MMKTDKEYPATHSMATAWYCVDEDGNVGIIDIEDNGPVPAGEYRDNDVNEVFWYTFSQKNADGTRKLNLTEEQILPMLETYDDRGEWKTFYDGWSNFAWGEVIVKIDKSKYDILVQASKRGDPQEDYFSILCLSEKLGLYWVDFQFNRKGVELLEENHVVLEKYKAPYYSTLCEEDDNDDEAIREKAINEKFPLFIYFQDYWPNCKPAVKIVNPANAMKIEQLPESIQKSIRRLPIRFVEHEQIQLAELMPVESIWSRRIVYDGKEWWELASTDGRLIYYHESTNTIMSKEQMDRRIASGEAEEWDYHKHNEKAIR